MSHNSIHRFSCQKLMITTVAAIAFLCSLSVFGEAFAQTEAVNKLDAFNRRRASFLIQNKPATSAATDPTALLVSEWTRAKTGIQEYIDAMPEDGINFKPTPQVRSFAEQMLHIAGANYMFASVASGRENPYDMSKGKSPEQMENLKASKAALKQFVLGSYDFVIEAIKGMKAEQMAGEVEFFKMKVPRHLLLAKALEHHAHHRGQTTIYLRLKGVTPPSERLF